MNLKDILLEVGEGGTSYELNKVEEKKAGDLIKIIYEFSTEKGTEYFIKIDGVEHEYPRKNKKDEYQLSVVFDVKNPERPSHPSQVDNPEDYINKFMTDEGNAIKVINTVIKAAKEVQKEYPVRWFKFSGVDRWSETSFNNARSRIYKRFIEKQFPYAEIEERMDYTKVIVSQYS